MGIKCGIVGLPNTGKSTLFNALTSSVKAQAANYPFSTIEPNVGVVPVPDTRLQKLAQLNNSEKAIPTQIKFIDIAGLVEGASRGEGLGNKFLSHIKEVDTICYVLRCFEDPDVIHINGRVDPIQDAEIIETELFIADIDSLQKQLINTQKKLSHNKSLTMKCSLIEELLQMLGNGLPARTLLNKDNAHYFKELNLLTDKPFLYICNIGEDDINGGNSMTKLVYERAIKKNAESINICVQIEKEINNLDDYQDREAFFRDLGIKANGLNRLIESCYKLLRLQTFFTIGPKEVRAWTYEKGSNAQFAARLIHTDFATGFICAEIIAYHDFVKHGSEQEARNNGCQRKEGRNYIINDGDIILFRFNI